MTRSGHHASEAQGVLTRMVRARQIGPRAVSAFREDIARDSRLGYGYLGIGAIVVGSLLILRGLIVFALEWSALANPFVGLIAWAIILVSFVGVCLSSQFFRGQLPTPAFLVAIALLATGVAVDLSESLRHADPILHTTSLFGIGATMLALVAYRPAGQLLILNAIVGAGLVVLLLTGVRESGYKPGPEIEVIVSACLPAVLGAIVVRGFGQLVQLELDRSLVESTLSAPRFAFGMRASDELARLDLAAERILQSVATDTEPLPLSPELAASASTLATQLRLLLVAGRHKTWLHHAIDESEVLGPLVTLTDPQGLAGYLDSSQRDGLLSAIWLLVTDSSRVQPTLRITIGPQSVVSRSERPDRIGISVDLTVDGIPRRNIDPAVWPALDRVGRHTELVTRGTVTIVTTARTVADDAVH